MKRVSLENHWNLEQVVHTKSFYTADPATLIDTAEIIKKMEVRAFPAEVHDILLDHGQIVNPNVNGRNKDLWIDEYDWIYRTNFHVEHPELPSRLYFGGLDTFCLCFLNGMLIGRYENVYRSYRTEELTNLQEENELIIYFFSPKKTTEEFQEAEEEQGYVLKECATRAFKSGFHDFCGPLPELIRVGIYREVVMEQREFVRITETEIHATLSEDFQKAIVEVKLSLEGAEKNTEIKLELFDHNEMVVAATEEYDKTVLKVEFNNPHLWWPKTHGEPYCYKLLISAGGENGDQVLRNIGFRTLENRGDLDFYINGKKIRLYGANLVHPDTLSNVYRPERVKRLLDLAMLANFNCLRVWGESEVYPDEFYDLCDKKGILLWHDFYLCYAMYSEQEHFLREIRTEAEELVRRLRHHPSILLWCGGNEVFLSRDYDFPGHYCFGEKILKEVFPSVCKELDPERTYHICSPYEGRDANDPEHGDTHGYTHLWFVPGRLYPNFLSENCRVSVPPMRSMRRMMSDEELWPENYDPRITPKHRMPWPDTWTQHNSNSGYVKLGPVDNYFDPTCAEELVYRIGAAHAEYIRRDVERFRRGYSAEGKSNRRAVNGHILWKFNNNSNIITYGVVDYFNEVYIPYYELKRMYSPVLLSIEWGNHAHVFLTNDSVESVKGTLKLRLLDMEDNRYIVEESTEFEVKADASVPVTTLDVFGQFRRKYVVVGQAFDEEEREIARVTDWFDTEKRMEFPIKSGIRIHQDGKELVVSSKKYVHNAELIGNENGDEFGFIFSDNYFELLPGEEKRVRVFGRHKAGCITVKSIYADDQAEVYWREDRNES